MNVAIHLPNSVTCADDIPVTFVPSVNPTLTKTSIMDSSGKVLLGVLAGIAAGATLGILFAPDKGSNTRKKIVDKSNDYADDLTKRFNEFADGLTKKVEKMGKQVEHAAQNVNHSAATAIEDVTATVNKANR